MLELINVVLVNIVELEVRASKGTVANAESPLADLRRSNLLVPGAAIVVNVIVPDLALAIAHPGIVATGLVFPIIVTTTINIVIIVMTKTMTTPVLGGAVVLIPDDKPIVSPPPQGDMIVSHLGTTMHENPHAHVETRTLTIIHLIVRTGSTSVHGYPVVVLAHLMIGNTKITDGREAVPGQPMLVEVLETG